MINEIEKHVQALENLFTCIIYLQDLLDNSECIEYVYDTLSDYLIVIDQTLEFLSRMHLILKSSKIEEVINNGLE